MSKAYIAHAHIGFDRHAQRPAKRLENGFGLVVRIDAAQVVDVQRHPGVIDEAPEKFQEQVDIEFTDARTGVIDVIFQPRPAGQIDHHARQRFVERHIGMAVATYALLVAERLREGLAEGNARVFHRVVRIDVQIALGLDIQVDQTVTRNLIQHVIEKRHAGGERADAGAVEIEADRDLGFQGIAGNLGGAHGV